MSKPSDYLKIESPSSAFTHAGRKPRPRWHGVLDAVNDFAETVFWTLVEALPIVLWVFCILIVFAALISTPAL